MNDVLKNPQHVAKIGFNGFNMEQSADFTASSGMLLPVYYDFLYPGDKFKGLGTINLRTQPLLTPANFKASVRLDWFAVPVKQLFKFFGSMYYNIDDIGTDLVQTPYAQTPATIPSIGVVLAMQYLSNIYSSNSYTSGLKRWNYDSALFASPSELNDAFRLLDCLHWPVAQMFDGFDSTWSFTQNVLYLAAYQKIYNDFFRIDDREVNQVQSYNCDSYYDNSSISQLKFRQLTRLRYAPFNKDLRTNVFVSPLQGSQDIGSLGITDQLFNSWLTDAEYSTINDIDAESNSAPTTVARTNGQSSVAVVRRNLNAASIRQMFAVEKCLEITRRAGKHFDAQTLAHWGVKLPDSLTDEVIYLGSQTQPFIVGDITSTSATDDEPLGTLAGKGYSGRYVEGSKVNFVDFESRGEFYIVMALFSVNPEVSYTQRGFDRLQALVSPKDFVHPEFDNLGMQPFYWYQYLANDESKVTDYNIYGWQYAYSESKIKENRVFGGVHSDGLLHSWVPQFDSKNYNTNGKNAFLSNPEYFNDILVYPFKYRDIRDNSGDSAIINSSSYALLYERDPFIVHADFSCYKSSKMSKYSLPNL